MLVQFADWRPQPSHDVAVESSSLVVRVPRAIHCGTNNTLSGQPETAGQKGGTTYAWRCMTGRGKSQAFCACMVPDGNQYPAGAGDFEEADTRAGFIPGRIWENLSGTFIVAGPAAAEARARCIS